MNVDLSRLTTERDVIAIALSGGSDSMALLHFMREQSKKYGFTIIALNVEHGIRGASSIADTDFVKNYCAEQGITLLSYSVDSVKKAQNDKLSIEEAARILRYDCFYDAINTGKCTKVATAHHLRDNAESVLINLVRGTGLKGVAGITPCFENKIIRPFLSVTKEEIEQYISINNIPFVTDESNFDTDYTRNFIRQNVLPELKKVFPDAEKSIGRFTEIARSENEFLDQTAKDSIKYLDDSAEILLPLHPAILSRASVYALKHCGIKKDWEKVHVDSIVNLSQQQNGAQVSLPKNVIAIKEYNKIVFFVKNDYAPTPTLPYAIGTHTIDNKTIELNVVDKSKINLKSGLYLDNDKVPSSAVIRFRRDGDTFTKFGGGTKKLNDFFTDKKIPLRLRDEIPLVADKNIVLAIFGVAVSDLVKVDERTNVTIELIKK